MLALSRYLAWLGVLPFVLGISITLLNSAQFQFFFGGLNGETIFVAYSAIILSFMAGALWGLYHRQPTDSSDNKTISTSALLITNVWAVLAWVSVLIFFVVPNTLPFILFVLALGYAHILWVEKQAQLSDNNYLSFRKHVTVSVITLHLLLLLVHI